MLFKDPIFFEGGVTNLYGYVFNDPIKYIDINGRGPISFAGCTAFNAGLTLSALDSAADISRSTELLQDQISRVDEEIRKCPLSDTRRLEELDGMRRDLARRMSESLREAANANNNLGLGAVGQAMLVEGACGLLASPALP